MHMLYKRNATVTTSNGEDVGRVDRLVIDPKTKEVTHIVVRQGFLFTEDKVVPTSLIGSAAEDSVTLRPDAGDLEALPQFEETHYIRLEEEDWRPASERYGPDYAPPIFWYPPPAGAAALAYPLDGPNGYVARTEQNIPEGTVALKQGAKVISAEGKEVGSVDEVLTDAQASRATDLVISQGMLIREKKRVPVNWISMVGEDEVHLAVVARTLDRLRPYSG
jgi:uncharacterized protein YrrD